MTEHTETEHDVGRELDALAAEAEREGAGEWEPGEDAAAESSGPDPQTVQMVQAVAGVGFQIVAARRGKHWLLSEEELQALSEPAAECLEKYAPDVAVGPEAALLLAAGMITAPRMMHDRALAEQAARERAKRAREQADNPKGEEPAKGGADE